MPSNESYYLFVAAKLGEEKGRPPLFFFDYWKKRPEKSDHLWVKIPSQNVSWRKNS